MHNLNVLSVGSRPADAFAVNDLLLIQGWSAAHDLTMRIGAEHDPGCEVFEAVVALYPVKSPVCRAVLWRNDDAVFVQPLLGGRRRFAHLADALESLLPLSAVVLTDIVASVWPAP